MGQQLEPFEDPNNKGNSYIYYTGKPCIEPECNEPAGTVWSPFWCFKHNVERIKRISIQLDNIVKNKAGITKEP